MYFQESSEVIPTLTRLALHAAHPFRDFLCALFGTGFE
jgi:hypothetical protein